MGGVIGNKQRKDRNRCIGHCCKEECFSFDKDYQQKFSKELSRVLKKNKLQYLSPIIMEFVGTLEQFDTIHSNEGYHAYLHPFLLKVYHQTGLPCSKSVKVKDIPPLSTDDIHHTGNCNRSPVQDFCRLGHHTADRLAGAVGHNPEIRLTWRWRCQYSHHRLSGRW